MKTHFSDAPCLCEAAYSLWRAWVYVFEKFWTFASLKTSSAQLRITWVNPFWSDCRDRGPEEKGSGTNTLWGGWENTHSKELCQSRCSLLGGLSISSEGNEGREWERGIPSQTLSIFTINLEPCPCEPQKFSLKKQLSFTALKKKVPGVGLPLMSSG